MTGPTLQRAWIIVILLAILSVMDLSKASALSYIQHPFLDIIVIAIASFLTGVCLKKYKHPILRILGVR
jgi:uncharacterized integral membrane protein